MSQVVPNLDYYNILTTSDTMKQIPKQSILITHYIKKNAVEIYSLSYNAPAEKKQLR